MTNEEAIEQLKSILETGVADADVLLYTEDYEAIDYAINSLAQKPCEDCINRQAAIDALYALCDTGTSLKENPWRDNPHIDAITDAIEDLPPVTPQPKTGQWIEKDGFDGDTYYDCSKCGESWTTIDGTPWDNGMKFCPNCGAKMEVEG